MLLDRSKYEYDHIIWHRGYQPANKDKPVEEIDRVEIKPPDLWTHLVRDEELTSRHTSSVDEGFLFLCSILWFSIEHSTHQPTIYQMVSYPPPQCTDLLTPEPSTRLPE